MTYLYTHCVYFAERDGLIKIGTSTQVDIRCKTLKARLLGVVPGSYAKEAEMHKRFALDHMHGEWYSDSTPIREFVATLPLELAPDRRPRKATA